MGLSVIVPVAKNDEAWRELMLDLVGLDAADEVIFVSYVPTKINEATQLAKKLKLNCKIQWQRSAQGRARQLNAGARKASGDYLWFLHCDSHIQKKTILKLKKQLRNDPERIYFLRLIFKNDGPALMKLNDIGVWFRSEILKLPFGDQGFGMHKAVFHKLKGFSEQAPYGEDHLFIWKAHQNSVRVTCLDAPIYTSSRRYKTQGWFLTTLRHFYLTYKQATPEFLKLVQNKSWPYVS